MPPEQAWVSLQMLSDLSINKLDILTLVKINLSKSILSKCQLSKPFLPLALHTL